MYWMTLALSPALAKKPKPMEVPGLELEVLPIELVEKDEDEAAEDAAPEPPPVEGEEEEIIDPWMFSEGDEFMDIRFSMRNNDLFTTVTISGTNYQPHLENILPRLTEELYQEDDQMVSITPGEPLLEENDTLGPHVLIPLSIRDDFMETDLYGRAYFFGVESAGVLVTITTSKEEPEHLDEVSEEVLDRLRIKSPPVPDEELGFGKIEAEAGYSLTLPERLRILTEEEARGISSERLAGGGPFAGMLSNIFVVDTGHLQEPVFNCRATTDGTLEVIEPKRSPRSVDNFKAFSRVQFKGGRYRLVSGSEEFFIDVSTEQPVQPGKEGEVQFVSLDDHDAYIWGVEGELYGDPVEASIFYTAYDDVGLTCITVAEKEHNERIGTFESTMRGVRIRDGELHPMHFSLKARYLRWWPSTHPALQLYWVPLPIFLLAGWLIVKE